MYKTHTAARHHCLWKELISFNLQLFNIIVGQQIHYYNVTIDCKFQMLQIKQNPLYIQHHIVVKLSRNCAYHSSII